MLIRKNIILLVLFALHAGADVFKTNEIPVVPAEDLVPPPEDQESLIVRYQPNDQTASKSFFQRVVTWFGFNGDQKQAAKTNKIKTQKQQAQKQNGYIYENPAKPFSAPPPNKLQQSPGYNYEDPEKLSVPNGFRFEPSPLKLQQEPFAGYTYDAQPFKLQQQPQQFQNQFQQTGYNYDLPPVKLQKQPIEQPQNGYTYNAPPLKLQQQPTTGGYTYNPPPIKLQQQQQQPSNGYTYNPPPVKLQQQQQQQQQQQPSNGYTYDPPPIKLQDPPKPQPTGYSYNPPPVKFQQRPVSLNDLVSKDLVSSAASPTVVYAPYNVLPNNQFSQQQQQQQNTDSFPCNRIPWMPMFPSPGELSLLRAKLQARQPTYLQSGPGYQNIQPIARPQPEKITQQPNAHTYLPPFSRPLRQPSHLATPNQINSLPLQSTATPFRAPSPTISSSYLPSSQKIVLPIETTAHSLVPIPVPNLSITPVPPLHEPKPFTVNDAQGIYINGHLVTPTGLSTTSVQTLQIINQNHPVTQSQKIIQPTASYGVPVSNTYGTPPVTYGPPTNTYGTPPIRLTAEVTESSVFSRFAASQPFTPRPTISTIDQTRLNSGNVDDNSNLMQKPIVISDSAADASESTHSPQDANESDENQPILQVLQELNVTTSPQGFQYTVTSTEPTPQISSASQIKKKEKKPSSDRETPIDMLDTRTNGAQLPEFKRMRPNSWKAMAPNPFSNPSKPAVVTTAVPQYYSSPVTPSAASSAFQAQTGHDANTIENHNFDNNGKKKISQIIIPYTKNGRPSPFKNNAPELQSFESSAGWSNSQHNDDHDSEESQVISSATPSPKPGAKRTHSPNLNHVLVKNLRDLLKREHLKNISTVDLAKLQKNIDGWTEQEFSMSLNRASTISQFAQPKHIPFEYLVTTTQPLQDAFTTETMQPTTDYPSTMMEMGDSTESEDSQDEGETMDEENEDENEIRGQDTDMAPDEQEAIQQAEEIEEEDFKRLDYLKSLENNHASGTEHRIFYATNPPAPQPRTTTPVPPCSTTTPSHEHESGVRTTVLPSADELWNKLKSLLSSANGSEKEKVYIVTPQPYPYFESEKIQSDDDNEVVGNFKSPRFLVRPTPGASSGRSSNSFARLTFKPRADRLQATTVKTTWNDASTDPVTEVFRSSRHSHSVVNGHAHAQAFSYVTPNFDDDIHSAQVDENDDDLLPESDSHRRSLHEYKA